MSDLISAICDDAAHYRMLCEHFNETPVVKSGRVFLDDTDLDFYGAHAKELEKRYNQERRTRAGETKGSIETEVKIEIDRQKKFDEIYQALGRPEWQIQRNYVFSFDGNLLRIRHEAGKAFLTAKGKDLGTQFNSRPEIECEIPTEFFMGFSKIRGSNNPPRYYEKSRASKKFMNCHLCLDNFFGTHYLEIEGREEDIPRVIKRFGLEDFPIEKRSYAQMLENLENDTKK